MDFLENLNEEQKRAVLHIDGPVLVFAGAGSGKTRVLTYKVLYIIYRGLARPYEILAVTFTNKAAQEMKERISSFLEEMSFPYVGTFHSICTKLLRFHAMGDLINKNFVIYDDSDRRAVIRECLKELSIKDKVFSPERVIQKISKLKNRIIDPETYSRDVFDSESIIISEVYSLYEKKMLAFNALDFDDLLVKTVLLLKKNSNILEKYARQFKYILIDEYQDVNYVQYELIRMFSSINRNITAVGDDDQSIYRFRGAEMGILYKFEFDFPESAIYRLERNYRSTGRILEAANHLLKHNKMRKEKNLWTRREDGERIGFFQAADGRSEARFVALKIRELMRTGKYKYRDFAVFYRTNAQSRLFEETFIQEGIPYNLVGGTRFYERKEIKDLLAYLRVVVNENDGISLQRIINVPPRTIGKVSIERILSISVEKGVSLYEASRMFCLSTEGSRKARKELEKLLDIIDSARNSLSTSSAVEILDKIISKTNYMGYLLSGGKAEDIAREENIKELYNVMKEFEKISEDNSLTQFLSHISLISDIDHWEEDEGKVNLMTLHLTKGLEFPVVFITGLEEKFLPHVLSLLNEEDIEEERRLFYVGITRAKDMLFLSNARTRMSMGVDELRVKSRFLIEIPKRLLIFLDDGKSGTAFTAGIISDGICEEEVEPLSTGDRVVSEELGKGTVKLVNKYTAIVEFEDKSIRKVLRSFLRKNNPERVGIKYAKGERVIHREWGRGIVCALYPVENEVLVSFPGRGTRRVSVVELSSVFSNITERVID